MWDIVLKNFFDYFPKKYNPRKKTYSNQLQYNNIGHGFSLCLDISLILVILVVFVLVIRVVWLFVQCAISKDISKAGRILSDISKCGLSLPPNISP